MNLKFTVFLLILSLACCKCGLLNWFSGWTDELVSQNSKIKCKEKRETEKEVIKPDIRKPAADKIVSLIDIEEEKLANVFEQETTTKPHQVNAKAKRCSRGSNIVSAYNPLLGATRNNRESSPLVKRDSTAEDRNRKFCIACMSQAPCKLLGKCEECNKYCKHVPIFTNDLSTPMSNQTVGMSNRMAPTKKDDIFSKTLYPVSTFREGETKEIICRIVGIADTSDIETVTIWITTFSNRPPASLNGMMGDLPMTPKKIENTPEQNLRESEIHGRTPSSLPGMHIASGPATPLEIRPRFNDYEDDEDLPTFSKIRNNGKEKIKTNPDVIEGPPPFMENNNLVSAAKISPAHENGNLNNDDIDTITGEFKKPLVVQPKEFQSDESDESDMPSLLMSSLKPIEESPIPKNINKPTLLNRLRELTTSRSNKILNPKGNRNVVLPGKKDDQLEKINEAIQDVKSMVKNIQEEASKATEKRLLGASHTLSTPEDTLQKNVPVSQLQPALPDHVADNIKKVNRYFLNRAKDALDLIGPTEKKDQTSVPVGVDTDEHSEIAKNVITNFKKMPQFVLERFQDTLNGFDKEIVNTPAASKLSNDVAGEAVKENVEISDRFGGDDNDNTNLEENVGNSNNNLESTRTISNDDNEKETTTVDFPIQSSNTETPKNKMYKSKLEKYLTELKEKRQRKYSADKYLKNSPTKSDKMAASATEEETLEQAEPSTIQNTALDQNKVEDIDEENKNKPTLPSNILMAQHDLEEQRALLREKLRKFIEDIKLKASSTIPPLSKMDEPTFPTKKIINYDGIIPATSLDPTVSGKGINDFTDDNNFPQNLPTENADQVVGESNFLNNRGINDVSHFLPTVPNYKSNQLTESPNNFFKKYLDDLKAKQSAVLKPKVTTDLSFIQNRNQIPEIENQLEGGQDLKKYLLKDKLKKYVENLKKPSEKTIDQSEISDQLSKINSKVNSEMKNVLKSSSDLFKKDMLKEKLKNYILSLKKPMGTKLLPDLVGRSTEAQREEINSLKRKLEGLLKSREPKPSMSSGTNPLVSTSETKFETFDQEANVNNDKGSVINNDMNLQGAKAAQNDEIIGNIKQSTMDDQFLDENISTHSKGQQVDNLDIHLQSRGSISEGDGDLDWSHSLGKIVQSSSKPKEIFFIGSGIKLPLQITQGPDGSMDLSVDLEKLCSCYNSTCPKNQTAIEETVGAILEKEAELNEQLNGEPLDDVEIQPVQNIQSSSLLHQSVSVKPGMINKPSGIKSLLNNINANNLNKRKKKSSISKRSSDIQDILETLKNDNEENIKNNVFKDLPKLPLNKDELIDWGKKVQDSLTNTVQQFNDDVEELREEMEDTIVGANQNSIPLLNQDWLKMPSYNAKQLEDTLNEFREKANEMNNALLQKLEHESNLNNLLKKNGIQKSSEASLLNNKQMDIPTRPIPIENPLKEIANQANNAIKNIERQNTINKLKEKVNVNRIQLPKVANYATTKDPIALINKFKDNLEKTLPIIPALQTRMNEVNDDVVKIADSYQFGKANVLKKRLKQLDDDIEKYHENNEKLLSKESQKIFGGRNDETIEKEVSIVNRILSWIKDLASDLKKLY